MENLPKELSLLEIRKFMLQNNCKVTNHALVKHFRSFLTNKDTQDDARKQFKTYVNVLASIKHEGNEKYLVLRRKFYDEIPTEDLLNMTVSQPMSPASRSYGIVPSDGEASPMRAPPPYRPPPIVSPEAVSYHGSPRGSVALNRRNSSEIGRSGSEISFGSEFASVDVKKVNPVLVRSHSSDTRQPQDVGGRRQSADVYKFDESVPPAIPPRKRVSETGSSSLVNSRQNSVEEKPADPVVEGPGENKENVPNEPDEGVVVAAEENKLSVKEKMMKFNRFASEEEAKIPSPIGKKKPEKSPEETINAENLLQHPNAKEWLIAAAKSDYQLLAKLSSEHPTLVKLQFLSSYTALHWAAKHGNEDVIKLVAGKLKADVNARTNGGYTALHIATQFGRNDIFELLCNVYKADRDVFDWSGKKPLEYQKQMTSVSASTYSKIKARKKHSEKDSGFLRIGSLNVRVKKTTEAFSNFLGVGTNQTRMPPTAIRASAPPDALFIDKLHKTWGSADNIQQEDSAMPPPKFGGVKKRRQKRDIEYDPSNDQFSQSVPTTPSQVRAPVGTLSEHPDGESMGDSDSDTACGFDSNWRPTYI
ncbi:ankyrin repeat domain-containing protein SOWAHC [Anopheles ziemanni]|uniref:ankyrin repeat domain-containing protein SOWAHC n=1 Tax=Anopheles coustani TaxID=139045 RepID=UPI002659F105|nr:ankyrin repeat domain-containing protein SOWAHC [Anopheles coustani]XP_058167999.1 ankyrin repeat domain-containing protein SOWAHC [Anopheles ziemanni]